jgi:hypothetical protein
MEKYRVHIYGDVHDVGISFFEGMEITYCERVGDTFFIRFANGDCEMMFSIYWKYWEMVQSDLRDRKIDMILGE